MSNTKKRKKDTQNSMALQNASKIYARKGKLKGKNKEQTKMLKDSCVHHVINAKGKIKSKTFPTDIMDPVTGVKEKVMVCKMCKTRINPEPYSNKDIKRAVKELKDINNQMKFLAVAVGCGAKATDFCATFGTELRKYETVAKRINSITQKKNAIKADKKDHKSEDFGSWSRRK